MIRSLEKVGNRNRTARRKGIKPRCNSKKHQLLYTIREKGDMLKDNFVAVRPERPSDSKEKTKPEPALHVTLNQTFPMLKPK